MGHAVDMAEYDLDDRKYWDEAKLDTELRRVTDICNGCRLCFNLCPSFPFIFERMDAKDPNRADAEGALFAVKADGQAIEEHEAAERLKDIRIDTTRPVDRLEHHELKTMVDLCFQCKLCYPKCPYVPPHEFAVDFPGLMQRARNVETKKNGVGVREAILGHTDLVGSVMTKVSKIANFAQHEQFNRKLMSLTVGIHPKRNLPDWADETFREWWEKRAPLAADPEKPKVALFHTCHGNHNDPEVPKAVTEVLEHNGCDVSCPPQKCCGMPFLDSGMLDKAREQAAFNVESMIHAVEEGRKIVSPGPSCTLVMKHEYPKLVRTEAAKKVAEAVVDAGDFLLQLHRKKQLKKDFKGRIGKIAYHVPCHNKVQNIGFRGRDLLKQTGATVEMVDRCCGMDGTWGMKNEYFDHSIAVAKKAIEEVKAAGDEAVTVTDCPLAAVQLAQGTGRKAYHPAVVLRACYRGEAPAQPIPVESAPPEEKKP